MELRLDPDCREQRAKSEPRICRRLGQPTEIAHLCSAECKMDSKPINRAQLQEYAI
jgi:uncharacterized membrane protein